MGVPTHECTVTYDGDELVVISPKSMLDCDNPKCRQRADIARQGTGFNAEYIERLYENARNDVAAALDTLALWELVREAKQREITENAAPASE